MDVLVSCLVGGAICAAATFLALAHKRAWAAIREQNPDGRDYDFHWRQYRRRVQTTAILGAVGAAIVGGQLLATYTRISPWLLLTYWGVIVLLLGWMSLLAAVDFLVTRHHYARLRDSFVVEQARLRQELRQYHQAEEEKTSPPADDADAER